MTYFIMGFMVTLGVVAGLLGVVGIISIIGSLVKYSVKKSVRKGLKNHLNKE